MHTPYGRVEAKSGFVLSTLRPKGDVWDTLQNTFVTHNSLCSRNLWQSSDTLEHVTRIASRIAAASVGSTQPGQPVWHTSRCCSRRPPAGLQAGAWQRWPCHTLSNTAATAGGTAPLRFPLPASQLALLLVLHLVCRKTAHASGTCPQMESYALGDVFARSGYRPKPMVPLVDAQIQSFIEHGFLSIAASDLGPAFHAGVVAAAESLDASELVPGWSSNDCYPTIPQLGDLLTEPHVHGALTGLLGGGYAMHPHRHCHIARPGNNHQGIHQDSYEDDEQVRAVQLPRPIALT